MAERNWTVDALTGSIFYAIAARVSRQTTGELAAAGAGVRRFTRSDSAVPLPQASRAALGAFASCLQGGSEEIQHLWKAVQSLSRWLSAVLRAAQDRKNESSPGRQLDLVPSGTYPTGRSS